MRFLVTVIALATVFTTPAFAQEEVDPGYPQWTEAEKRAHLEKIDVIVDTAAACLERTWQDHVSFFNEHRISKFYGSRRKDYAKRADRIAAIQRAGKSLAEATRIADMQTSTSCVGLARQCLKEGFTAAGQRSMWDRIDLKMRYKQRVFGTDLQRMLQDLGWTLMYWNPDPSQNAAWDEEDRRLTPPTPLKPWQSVWGNHAAYYRSAMNRDVYYHLPVNDKSTLVGFGRVQPAAFTAKKFFVGTAHAGYHVFPGANGRIIEAHSMRDINSFSNMEISEFNPLKPGGGPKWTRTEKYRSGVVVVPPSR